MFRSKTLLLPIWSVPRINGKGLWQFHSESGSWHGMMRRARGMTSNYAKGIKMRNNQSHIQSLQNILDDP